MSESERSQSKLHEMVMLGKDYREDYDFELYGEEVTVVLRTLPDIEFLPILAVIADHMGLEDEIEEMEEEVVDEALDEIDEARDEEGTVDISKLDKKFVATMQEAAKLGLEGTYDHDGEKIDLGEDEAEEMVEDLRGGYSVELGGEVLDISGNVRDAEKFREHWGRERPDSS